MTDSNQNMPEDSDPTIDALLDQFLAQSKPRQLDADALAAAVAQATFASDFEVERYEHAHLQASRELAQFLAGGSIAAAAQTPAPSSMQVVLKEPTQRSLTTRIGYGLVAVIAASGLLFAASLMQVSKDDSLAKNDAVSQPNPTAENPKESPKPAANLVQDDAPKSVDPKPAEGVVVNQEKLPFGLDRDQTLPTMTDRSESSKNVWTADQEQVLATVNSQFQQLWDRLTLEPSIQVGFDEWRTRAALAVTGKVSPLDLEESLKDDARAVKAAYLEQLLVSDEFVELWSSRIASEFFKLQPPSQGSSQESFLAAKSLIADSIRKDQSLVALWETLLATDSAENGSGSWWKSHESHNGATRASLLLSTAAGSQSACVQCHTTSSDTAVALNQAALKDFWQLAGLLEKLEANSTDGLRWQLGRELFFETDDGTMKLASPGFASIDAKATAKEVADELDANQAAQSWATWIVQSPATRESFVDVVWSSVFHSRLVSDLSEQPEFTELSELRSFLATTTQGTNVSLRSLLKTILLSDAFAVPTAEPTDSWYLMANESNIEQLRKQIKTFSLYAPNPDATVVSNDRLLAWLSEMNKPAPVALAQPQLTEVKPTPKPATGSTRSLNASQLDWLIRSQHQSPANMNWIQGLATADMEWSKVVDHAYLSTIGRFAYDDEQRAAKELLDISVKRDVALARLLATLSLK